MHKKKIIFDTDFGGDADDLGALMKDYYTGKIIDNASFDQTAVLYAVRGGIGEYWTKISDSVCSPDEKGGNTWEKSENSNHSYLKLKMDEEELASLIESIMLADFS